MLLWLHAHRSGDAALLCKWDSLRVYYGDGNGKTRDELYIKHDDKWSAYECNVSEALNAEFEPNRMLTTTWDNNELIELRRSWLAFDNRSPPPYTAPSSGISFFGIAKRSFVESFIIFRELGEENNNRWELSTFMDYANGESFKEIIIVSITRISILNHLEFKLRKQSCSPSGHFSLG